MTAREAALTLLERCRRSGTWSSQALDQLLRRSDLSEQDSALTTSLFLGVIQNHRYLDHYIDLYCRSGKLEPKLRDLLRLGACQILLMDRIPAHAAVNETVALCRKLKLDRAAGLVNAVMRRLSENRDRLPEIPGKGSAAYLAVRYSQEDWLAEKLMQQHGYSFAEEFFRACQLPPDTDLQINTLKTDLSSFEEKLVAAGCSYRLPTFPSNCISVGGGKVPELPGFREGLFFVQDRAAAMAVEIADPHPGMRVLDACAAPGGKSFAAAVRMENKGAVLSCDIHGKKLGLIRTGAERLGISCLETAEKDAGLFDPAWAEQFDLVIADVPCSGLGVMRKKPEIRFKKQDELSGLPSVQRRILDNLARYVAPGGTLIYSTCTVLQEENEEIVRAFLQNDPTFESVDFSVGGRQSNRGCYTFWPQVDGTDGFFAAKLMRKK